MSKTKDGKFELISLCEAQEQLLAKATKNLDLYFLGLNRAKAELLGYAFLIGNELNRMKEVLPHGQFEEFVEQKYQLPETTQQRWREHAECVISEWKRLSDAGKNPTVGLLKSPLDLCGKKKFNAKQQEAILEIVPQIMGRKGMVRFIEDCKLMREPKPDGGYRPSPSAVQAWLKEFHKELVGTKYDDLPKAIQKEYRGYVPPPDPEVELEILRARWSNITGPLGEELEQQSFVGLSHDEMRRIRTLLNDAVKAFDEVLNKVPAARRTAVKTANASI